MIDDLLQNLETHPLALEFGNSLTTSEFLQELYSYIKKNINEIDRQTESIKSDFEKRFTELLNDYKSSTSDRVLLERFNKVIEQYCMDNINKLISDSLKYITFELDEEGYFIALIPECYAENLTFNTIIDSESADYGKLIIEY